MVKGFADDLALYYLVMDGGMVLDDLVHLLCYLLVEIHTCTCSLK
jgi:hypothetical protein